MSYRISLDGTDRTFQDIADAAEYARQLSGAERKRGEGIRRRDRAGNLHR